MEQVYTLYSHAAIYTMDKKNKQAEAFVVHNGRFVFVGSFQDAQQFVQDKNHQTIHLGGQMVLPAFCDSHLHSLPTAINQNYADLTNAKSIKEIQEILRQHILQHDIPEGAWVFGRGWNHDYFTDERRFPYKEDLDAVCPNHPVIISRACLHIATANTKALDHLNLDEIDEDLRKLSGKNEQGEYNGILKENLLLYIQTKLNTLTKDKIKALFLQIQKQFLQSGITSVHSDDFSSMPGDNYHLLFEAMRELEDEKKLVVSVFEQCLFKTKESVLTFLKCSDQFITQKICPIAIKLLSDGSLGARTAALRNHYADDEEQNGLFLFDMKELTEIVTLSDAYGMPVAIHAIGDRAIDHALSAIEAVRQLNPHSQVRHGIVHCQITDQEMIKRFKKWNVLAYIQPIFIDYDMHIVEQRVGKTLAKQSYAWRSYLNNNVHIAIGTDSPVESFHVFPNIYCAYTRKNIAGDQLYLEEEALDMEDILYAYTMEGAYAASKERERGSIKAGKVADFVVLDQNLFELNRDRDILTTKVLETYVDGFLAYKN